MNWDRLLKFASYYGLRFKFDYNDEKIEVTLEYRDENVSYVRTRSFEKPVYDKIDSLAKAILIYDMMNSLAEQFELEGKDKRLI